MKSRRWLWSSLFVLAISILGALATSWNWVLVQHYQSMLDLAKDRFAERPPWVSLLLGSVGFVAAIVALLLFFLRLLREMKLNQLHREFLTRVTHELKTPLATLELTSSLLKEKTSTEEEKASLWEGHDSELRRLKADIERLLSAARWEQVHEQPHLENFHLESWIHETYQRWELQTLGQGQIKREGDPLNFFIRSDRALLQMITGNLVDNARKFSDGRMSLTIHTRSLSDGNWEIIFRDEGIGFDPKLEKKIFRRFYRARNAADHGKPGTGLGLHLVSTACRALDLKIEARSAGLGQGAEFRLVGGKDRG